MSGEKISNVIREDLEHLHTHRQRYDMFLARQEREFLNGVDPIEELRRHESDHRGIRFLAYAFSEGLSGDSLAVELATLEIPAALVETAAEFLRRFDFLRPFFIRLSSQATITVPDVKRIQHAVCFEQRNSSPYMVFRWYLSDGSEWGVGSWELQGLWRFWGDSQRR